MWIILYRFRNVIPNYINYGLSILAALKKLPPNELEMSWHLFYDAEFNLRPTFVWIKLHRFRNIIPNDINYGLSIAALKTLPPNELEMSWHLFYDAEFKVNFCVKWLISRVFCTKKQGSLQSDEKISAPRPPPTQTHACVCGPACVGNKLCRRAHKIQCKQPQLGYMLNLCHFHSRSWSPTAGATYVFFRIHVALILTLNTITITDSFANIYGTNVDFEYV